METPAYTGYINLYYNLVHQSTSHYFKEYCRQQLSGPGGQGSASSNGQAGPRPPGARFNGPGTGQQITVSDVSGGQSHLQNSPGVASGGMNSYNWSEAQQHHPQQQQQQSQPQQHHQPHAPQQLSSQSQQNQPQQPQSAQQQQEHRNSSSSHHVAGNAKTLNAAVKMDPNDGRSSNHRRDDQSGSNSHLISMDNNAGVSEIIQHPFMKGFGGMMPGHPMMGGMNHGPLSPSDASDGGDSPTAIENRPFPCNVCGKRFKQKAVLYQHERTHTGVKPYGCPECGKMFRQQTHLVQHVRIHTGEKPYTCPFCERCFRQKTILDQHLRTHTGIKPYHCPECGKQFRQKAILNQHFRIHLGAKPYCCYLCRKSFAQRAVLDQHLKTHLNDSMARMGMRFPMTPRGDSDGDIIELDGGNSFTYTSAIPALNVPPNHPHSQLAPSNLASLISLGMPSASAFTPKKKRGRPPLNRDGPKKAMSGSGQPSQQDANQHQGPGPSGYYQQGTLVHNFPPGTEITRITVPSSSSNSNGNRAEDRARAQSSQMSPGASDSRYQQHGPPPQQYYGQNVVDHQSMQSMQSQRQ